MAVAVRLLDQRLRVLGVDCVQDVEQVLSVGQAAFGKAIRQIGHDSWVRLELGKQVHDAKLVIARHLNPFHLAEEKQLFFLDKDLPEVVLVDHGLGWDIQLHCRNTVRQKISLTLLLEISKEIALGAKAM